MPEMTVKIGEKEYPFKKINMTIFKAHLAFMKKNAARTAGEAPNADDAMDGMLEMTQIIFECIKRAQTEVTLEEIMEGLDQDNIGEAFAKVMQGGKFVPAGEKLPAVG